VTVKGAQPVRISAEGASDLDTCAELLREYAESLGIDLSFQWFDKELAMLPGAYAPPTGT
jgi:putative acetyltransferase